MAITTTVYLERQTPLVVSVSNRTTTLGLYSETSQQVAGYLANRALLQTPFQIPHQEVYLAKIINNKGPACLVKILRQAVVVDFSAE